MIGGMAVAPEICSYGLRNPFRTNMDACTGDIYFGDVGHFDWEEVDVEPAGTGHHNYGWPVYHEDTCLWIATARHRNATAGPSLPTPTTVAAAR
jgi:glucose/arabinose dehydrogenase